MRTLQISQFNIGAQAASPPTLRAQQGDNDVQMLAKLLESASRPSSESGGIVYDRDGNRLQVLNKVINQDESTTATILTAQTAGFGVRVLSVILLAGDTAVDVTFQSKVGSADDIPITPLLAFPGNGGVLASFNKHGWFTTLANGDLRLTTGAGSTVGLLISYVRVKIPKYVIGGDGDYVIGDDGQPTEENP